ncbi:MAG: hypothetical protein CVU46_11160 [Chloroflexi bacterium HGW-Chloroflexi-8]|jgi:endonuclease YncB( thermonuclease family)|nr:MAG: hypothetical protein CVU46_11160 [Chloroflexi bacterium HGW-Chloroflexi-8]
MKILSLIILLLLSFQQEVITGKVIGVTDGDSVVLLLEDKTQLKVRLEGIDCPESHQDYGEKAKQETVRLCFQKEVTLHKTGLDRYGRTLGFIFVGDTNVNRELVRTGYAWHYKKYSKDPDLAELERNARSQRLGLWSQPNPEAPWDFRHK